MKNYQKIAQKFKKITKNDILKAFFVVLLLILNLFLFLNYQTLDFYYNGFGSLKGAPVQVYYLDVGQASATLLVINKSTIVVIDTGSEDSKDKFLTSVNRVLKENHLSEIDYLILTHSDEDHVGGTQVLLDRYRVHNIFRPKILSLSYLEVTDKNDYKLVLTNVWSQAVTSIYSEPNCNVKFIENDSLSFGEVEMDFYPCKDVVYQQVNDYCPFITLSYNDYTFMFTGDATVTREEELLQYLEENNITLNVDFLSVAHHGSKTSSSLEFLQAIQPSYAFVSTGTVSHLSDEVYVRLKAVGVKDVYVSNVISTSAVGIFDNKEFKICAYTNYFDVALVVTVMFLGCFVIMRFDISSFERLKKRKKFLKNNPKIATNQ